VKKGERKRGVIGLFLFDDTVNFEETITIIITENEELKGTKCIDYKLNNLQTN
jgi:hypothetical protein